MFHQSNHCLPLSYSTSSWMCPVCRSPLSHFRACASMTCCGSVVLVPHQTPPFPACASMPPCAGTTRPSLYATSGCTGGGWEDLIPESPRVRWFWWDGRIVICSGWRSWRCRSPPAYWSWWWNQWWRMASPSQRATGEEKASATQRTSHSDPRLMLSCYQAASSSSPLLRWCRLYDANLNMSEMEHYKISSCIKPWVPRRVFLWHVWGVSSQFVSMTTVSWPHVTRSHCIV